MLHPKRTWADEEMDRIISTLLRSGVIVSALIVLAGGIWYLVRYGLALPEYGVFHGEPAKLRTISGILKEAFSFRTGGLIQLGLLVLIATPAVRVAFSVLAFALQRDRTYVVVTLIVLAILIYSLTGRGL
jgi:uncharacterized membrane protein